ncbi:hypothetical protein GGR58DRAFT_500479 [Xylaria digitata]|nr:hypothetical protein GGR58DRAFT_500479 [Xylaria digitata]
MATEISKPAQTAEDERLPPEIMLRVIGEISKYDWPEVWFKMRLLSQRWKYEVERIFRKRYLLNTTIYLIENLGGKEEYDFQYDPKQSSHERAFFKLTDEGVVKISSELGERQRWELFTSCLKRSGKPSGMFAYMIKLLELYVINNPELVGLQDDIKTHSISFEWIPTFNQLFKQETKIRQLARVDAE